MGPPCTCLIVHDANSPLCVTPKEQRLALPHNQALMLSTARNFAWPARGASRGGARPAWTVTPSSAADATGFLAVVTVFTGVRNTERERER